MSPVARTPSRPPRTAAHAKRDELTALFAAHGLVAVVSTNGSIPGADIELILGVQPGELRDAWLKPAGADRLGRAGYALAPHLNDVDRVDDCWCGAKPGQPHAVGRS